MKLHSILKSILIGSFVALLWLLPNGSKAQLGSHVIVGYFHNWDLAQAPYINLAQVDTKYNVVDIAFATPVSTTDMTMTFAPAVQTQASFIADIQTLHTQGRKVLISIGGADAPVALNTATDLNSFCTSMESIITQYGFDGFDIDLEGNSVILDNGDNNFKTPTTPKIVNLIQACHNIVAYFQAKGKTVWLTFAPETQYLQGGYGNYGSAFGGYIPVLYGVRDILTFVHTQYYNTGSQIGMDDQIYNQGTADFIVAMSEMLLKGFPVARNANNVFPALRNDQVAFGLPATNTGAAPAGGYVAPTEVYKALDYLIKGKSFGGQYVTSGTYPNLRGIMTWSINWDKTLNDAFATAYYTYFSGLSGVVTPTTISIVTPTSNQQFATGSTITITAAAADTAAITKVDFYSGTTLLGTVTTSPYTFSWKNVPAGSYSLTAKLTDAKSLTTTSAAVPITVATVANVPPVTSITTPTSGASFNSGSTVIITASATDADGTISKVDFYNGTTLLGTATTSPYTFNWTNVPAGSYSLTVKATDNSNAVTTSAAVNITVSTVVTGTCTIPAWSATAIYVGSSVVSRNGNQYTAKWWTQGQDPLTNSGQWDVWALNGPCGGGTTNINPTVSISSPINNKTFTAPASIAITATAADADGTVSKVDFYNGSTLLGTATASPYSFTWNNVAAGTYTLTAKATDNSGGTTTSSAITVVVTPAANINPTVSITAPANNANYTAPATVAITATASDADGTVSKVDFYNGATLLGTATASPYTFNWTNVAAGTYTLTAKATDNAGGTTTSSAITIVVKATANINPTVSITAPVNNATYTAPATVTITATASDADGTISKVDFYNGSTLLGTITASPYLFTWNNVAAGTYALTAKATDNSGGATTSSVITITVNPATTVDNCTSIPQYVTSGGNYGPGSIVKNVGNQYQCKPWPYSGWCNVAPSAYAPGTGTNWTDAWVLIGSCTPAPQALTSVAVPQADVPATTNDVTLYPNPGTSGSQETVTLLFDSIPGTIHLTVTDANGRPVAIQEYDNVQHTVQVVLPPLVPGLYIISIQGTSKLWTKKYLVD